MENAAEVDENSISLWFLRYLMANSSKKVAMNSLHGLGGIDSSMMARDDGHRFLVALDWIIIRS